MGSALGMASAHLTMARLLLLVALAMCANLGEDLMCAMTAVFVLDSIQSILLHRLMLSLEKSSSLFLRYRPFGSAIVCVPSLNRFSYLSLMQRNHPDLCCGSSCAGRAFAVISQLQSPDIRGLGLEGPQPQVLTLAQVFTFAHCISVVASAN